MPTIEADQKFLLKSSLLNFLGTALKVLGPALSIVVARFFGKEAFGIYISTQLWVSMMSRVAVLGLDRGLAWYIPQNKVHGRFTHEGIAESLKVGIFFALIIFSVISLMAFFGLQTIFSGLEGLSSTEIILYIASIVPWVIILIFAGASEGNRKPQYRIFINDFAVYTFAPLIALGLFFAGHKEHALPIGLFLANALAVCLYIGFIRKQFPKMTWKSKEKVPKRLLNYSLPLGFSEFITAFLLRADIWMVLILLGPKYAGVYAIMLTISNGLRTVKQGFNSVLLPVVAGMEPEKMKRNLPHVYSYCVSMVATIQLGVGFFIVLFPEETLMLAGKSFVQNPEVLGVLLFGNLFNGVFGLSGMVLNGMGRSKFLLKLNIYSLIFVFSLNFLLIPKFGLIGAAMSTLLLQIFQGVWMNVELIKSGLWPYKKHLWVQGFWSLGLLLLYILINTVFHPLLWMKIALFAVCLFALLHLLLKRISSKSKEEPNV